MHSSARYVQGVLSNAIYAVWQDVLPLIERALAYADGKYTSESILDALKACEMQLWIVTEHSVLCAMAVTRIMCYPSDKRLTILLSAGDGVMTWLPFHDVIQNFAKEKGCTSMEIYGRPGWEVLLKPYGYKKIHTVLKLDLPTTH